MLDKEKGLLERINWPLTILIIAIIWLAVGFGLLCTYNLWDWLVLYGFATWILAAGVVFAIWQIIVMRENARKSTSAQVAVDLFSRLREQEAVDALRTIYRNEPRDLVTLLDIKPEDEYKKANKEKIELKKGIECVLENLELIGALVADEIINKDMAIEVYGGITALRCWYALREYIIKARSQRGGLYRKNFENFAGRTLEHQKEGPKDERILFYKDDPNKPFDLIQYFIEHPDKKPEKRT